MIDYITNKYNKSYVSQIITFNSLTIKNAIKDISRVLGYTYIFTNKLIKLFNDKENIKNNLQNNTILKIKYYKDKNIRLIINLSLYVENTIKNIGIHAGGIIISPNKLINYISLYKKDYQNITSLDKNDIELIGLMKFDFLGLKTLTTIENSINTINTYIYKYKKKINTTDIKFNNHTTFNLIKKLKNFNIFQLESYGINKIIKKIKPNYFKDIIDLLALYRPGPLKSGMLNDFIKRKNNKQNIKYIHNDLKKILSETYGIIIYQEQIMQIVKQIFNYNFENADLLRYAISKKQKTKILEHYNKFIIQIKKKKINYHIGKKIFNLIEKFSSYGFNKSHSVGYSIITYYTAWLKSNFTTIYSTLTLSSDYKNNTKINTCIIDSNNIHQFFIKPDINKSYNCFINIKYNNILWGLNSIKGLSEFIIYKIIYTRNKNKYYNNFHKFILKTNLKKNSTIILINTGLFDLISTSRIELFIIIKQMIDKNKLINNLIINKHFKITTNKKKKINFNSLKYLYRQNNLLNYNINNIITYYIEELTHINNYNHIINNITFYGSIIKTKNLNINFNNFNNTYIKNKNKIFNVYTTYTQIKKNKQFYKKNELIFFLGKLKINKLYIYNIYNIHKFRYNFVKYFNIFILHIYISNNFLKNIIKILILKQLSGKCLIKIKIIKNNNINILKTKIQITPNDNINNNLKKINKINNTIFSYN